MANTVVGFFDKASDAKEAISKLKACGISDDRIDIASPGSASEGTVSGISSVDREEEHENGITRFFKNLFGSNDDDADRYSKVAKRSNSIVTVHARTHEEAESAADIMDDCGAVNVDERAAQYGIASSPRRDDSAADHRRSDVSDRGRRDIENKNEATIPRIEENLEVGKRTVERGGVRVRSRIVERPVEEHVRLREENIHVERKPVNRPVADAEANAFREREIELTERAEIPVVNKQARVVEEVKVTKDVNERDETVRDTVRNTEVDVNRTGKDRPVAGDTYKDENDRRMRSDLNNTDDSDDLRNRDDLSNPRRGL